MRKWLVLLCIVFQVGVLANMVFGRESVLRNGTRINIATAPIDPRDPFRGDFVRLRYPMNQFASAPVNWTPDTAPERGDKVYAVLKATPDKLYSVEQFTTTQPAGGLFIRGRRHSRLSAGDATPTIRPGQLDVKFGIEQLFVEQGTGTVIEDERGIRGGMQRAMHVEVAVGDTGTAVLDGYHWSDLGIMLQTTDAFLDVRNRQPGVNSNQGDTAVESTAGTAGPSNSNADAAPAHPDIIVTVKNLSDKAVILNNPGDNCGFQLEAALPLVATTAALNTGCEDNSIAQALVLESGQAFIVNIDLQSPRWQVAQPNSDGTAPSMSDLRLTDDNDIPYRIIYRSTRYEGLDSTFWQGSLVSQSFNGAGWID